MAKIHFDITGDNSNFVSTINDTTKRAEQFASLMKNLGSAGFDMSNYQAQIGSLKKAIRENEKVIENYRKKIDELQRAQSKAAMAGDTASVQLYGQRIRTLGEQMQETINETNILKQGFDDLNSSEQKNVGIMTQLLGGQEKYNAIVRQLPPVFQQAIQGLNGMVGAAKAFIATPLGIVLAGLIVAYKSLTMYLDTTIEGHMKLAEAMGYLKGLAGGIKQVFIDLGGAISNAINIAKNSVKDLGKHILEELVVRAVGFADLIGSAFGMLKAKINGDEKKYAEEYEWYLKAKRAIKTGEKEAYTEDGQSTNGGMSLTEAAQKRGQIDKERTALQQKRLEWAEQEAKIQGQILQLRSKMYTGTMAEREEAAAKAEELINSKYAKRLQFAREEYRLQQEEVKLPGSNLADKNKLIELRTNIQNIQNERTQEMLFFNRKDATADKSIENAELKRQNELNDLIIENREKRAAMEMDSVKRVATEIEITYDRTMESIKRKEEEWRKQNKESFGFEGLTTDQQAAIDEARNIAETQRKQGHLNDLLNQYKTYAQKRDDIIRQAEADIIELEKKGYKEQASERKKQMDKDLNALERQNSDFFKKLAKDRSKWLVGDVVDLLTQAQSELDKLVKGGSQDTEEIERRRREIENLKKELSSAFTPNGLLKQLLQPDTENGGKSFNERIEGIRKAWNEMTADAKWQTIGSYIVKIGAGLQKAAGYMQEIAELSGDSRLASTAEQLSAIAQNLSAAGQGAATGGGWGALAAGLSDLLGQTVEAFASAGAQEAIATKNANDWADALERMAFVVENSNFDTIFGTKNISLAQAKLKEALGYLEMYQKKVGEDAVGLRGDTFKSGIIAFEDAIEKGYTGLQRMLVTTKKQTGWAKFWGAQEEYTALGDLAPQLWKNGEFDVEAAKEFLKVNTQLTEEQRKQIENLVELKQGYDDAMKAVDDAISDTFGNLASDITDIIWDSVMNGTDAWEEFEKVGSEAIASLGKQLIQEMLISEYLEQYRDQMRKAYQSSSAEETQAQLRNIIGDIYGGMENMLAAGTLVAEEYKAWADEHDFDLTKLSASSQTAKAGGFEVMSQDTANELNGRFTALQISNELISQSAQEGLTYIITISDLVRDGNSALSDIRQLHTLELAHLEDISKYTKAMVGFGETLDKIKENTDRL